MQPLSVGVKSLRNRLPLYVCECVRVRLPMSHKHPGKKQLKFGGSSTALPRDVKYFYCKLYTRAAVPEKCRKCRGCEGAEIFIFALGLQP